MGSPNFEIIAGTYEEFLVGYNFIAEQSDINPSFAAHDHSSSIRSLCISGRYLATGAADDRIIVYDLKTRKEHCMLTHHDSTVSCLQFTSNHTHLLSGSSDGVLAIVRVGNWQVEKVWDKAHKGSAVLDIAVHTSGKFALTLGADLTLRTWNLVKGRQAYVINLNSKCNDAKSLGKIIWAEDGTRFILYGGKYTEVWSIVTGGMLKVIAHDEKVCSCIWFSENKILVGYENGQMVLFEINDLTKIVHQAHDSRVKVLALHNDWVVSGSSRGEIKVWNKELQEVAKYDIGCRITCLGIVPDVNIKKETILEDVQEQTASNTVMKKSSVVIEIEGDDDTSNKYDSPKVKNKLIKETIAIEVNEDIGHESAEIKGKMKKRKSDEVNKMEQTVGTLLPKTTKQRIEKKKIKKEQKQKHKKALVKDGAKQTPTIVGSFMGCGRKRKKIYNTTVTGGEISKKIRRRKLEKPIKKDTSVNEAQYKSLEEIRLEILEDGRRMRRELKEKRRLKKTRRSKE